MKKICLCLLAAGAALSSWAAGDKATITSDPSPAVKTKPVTITITLESKSYTAPVYVYSWCKDANGNEITSASGSWGESINEKYRMTGSGKVWSYTIDDVKSFYRLTDTQLNELSTLMFIARTSGSEQTVDLGPLEVVDAPLQEYSGGSGTEADPWLLSTAADLKALSVSNAHWGDGFCFKMTGDIDAAGVTAPIGNAANPFKGRFDGNGKLVKNLALEGSTVGDGVGLFGVVDGGRIFDLGVLDAAVNGATFTGILAGKIESGEVARCYTSGMVTAKSICSGGLVGENGGVITDCYSVATVTSSSYAAGGLVGKNTGEISRVIAAGNVKGFDYVGGVTGANYGKISKSIAVNERITSELSSNYAARFGGNNNSRNAGQDNHSWDGIPAGHINWSEYGDHAALRTSNDLVVESSFRTLTGWDFASTWKWQMKSQRSAYPSQGPVLQVHSDEQPLIYPQEFFNTVSGVEVVSAGAGISVGPNPTDGKLMVTAADGIAACAVYSMGGSQVASRQGGGQTEIELDITSSPAGVYILSVASEGASTAIFKIIKK